MKKSSKSKDLTKHNKKGLTIYKLPLFFFDFLVFYFLFVFVFFAFYIS